jgi:hypothetical protein
MQVFAADDDRPVHFGRHDGAGQDTATDRDHAGERALLVCKKKFSQLLFLVSTSLLPPQNPPSTAKAWFRRLHSGKLIAVRNVRVSLHTNVLALNSRGGRLEAQTNVLVPSPTTLARPRRLDLNLGVKENALLALECRLRLHGEFTHGGGVGFGRVLSEMVPIWLGFCRFWRSGLAWGWILKTEKCVGWGCLKR